MLELAFIVMCILGLCGVVGTIPICIVGLVYTFFNLYMEIVNG